MEESSKIVVARIVNSRRPRLILDAPCGNGWLREKIPYDATIDGIDLYNLPEGNYRTIISSNLDLGLPAELPRYDGIVSCEGIEHFGNPSLFIKTLWDHLEEGGFIVITTPNVWYPASRLQFLVRGFFPSFPALTGRTRRGEHMRQPLII